MFIIAKGDKMGLQEKRAIEEFKTGAFLTCKKNVETALGLGPEWDIQWDTLASEGKAQLVSDSLPKVFFEPLVKAFGKIGSDNLGKEALKGSIKKIVIKNVAGVWGENAYSFEDGILTVDHLPTTNIDDVEQRCEFLTKLLESKL
jgi:hypothetical protein